jgi:hypothetical protein
MNTNKILENKICKDCLIDLNINNINKYDLNSAQYVCKICRKQRDKNKYEKRKELIREQQRMYDLSIKIKIIKAYGGECICCKENILEFLTIKSINNDNKSGGKLYRWLIKNNFPEEYELLCYNCNNAKILFGYCPHNKD